LPVAFFAALAGMVAGYAALVEAGKRIFYHTAQQTPPARWHFSASRQLRRRGSRFSTAADRFAVPSGHR
jgi:Mg2+-importing ATPase